MVVCACGVAHWRFRPRPVGRNSRPVHCRDAWQNCSCGGHPSTNPQLQVRRTARLWRVSCQSSDISKHRSSLLASVLWKVTTCPRNLKKFELQLRSISGRVRECDNIGAGKVVQSSVYTELLFSTLFVLTTRKVCYTNYRYEKAQISWLNGKIHTVTYVSAVAGIGHGSILNQIMLSFASVHQYACFATKFLAYKTVWQWPLLPL